MITRRGVDAGHWTPFALALRSGLRRLGTHVPTSTALRGHVSAGALIAARRNSGQVVVWSWPTSDNTVGKLPYGVTKGSWPAVLDAATN